MTEIEYLWDHWKFNADQRLKAFNFFVVLSVFANGGLFSAVEKCVHPLVIAIVGGFIAALSGVFWLLDVRSRRLLHLSVPAIKAFEQASLSAEAQLFHKDEVNTKSIARYTVAFRVIFVIQLLFGAFVIAYGLTTNSPNLSECLALPKLSACKA